MITYNNNNNNNNNNSNSNNNIMMMVPTNVNFSNSSGSVVSVLTIKCTLIIYTVGTVGRKKSEII